MPSVNLIMLIFGLAVVGILVLSALFGFLAGLKREVRLTIEFIVILVLVWLVLGNVVRLLDMTLPGFAAGPIQGMLGAPSDLTSLREIIGWFLRTQFPDYKELLVEGTKTYAFLMSVIEFALRFVIVFVGTIVVYVLYLVIRLLTYLITRLVFLCTIKKRKAKRAAKEAKRETELEDSVVAVESDVFDGEVVVTVSRNPKKVHKGKRRGWAAGLGLLRGIFVVILLCVPITGLLSIVSEVEPETVDMVLDIMSSDDSSKTAAENDNDLINWVMDLADAYENSAVYKGLNVPEYFLGKRLDDAMFDDLFKIKTQIQTIYIRDEIISVIKIANILPECYTPDGTLPIDVWALSDEKQDEIFDLLKQIKLFAEIMPIAIEYAGTMDEVKDLLEKADQSLDGLKSVDWRADLPLIFDAVRAALELGNLLEEEFDPLQLESDVLRDIVSNLGATTFLKELMPVAINCALYIGFVEDIVGPWDAKKEGRIDTSKVSWKDELLNLVDIYEMFQDLELDFNEIDINALLGDDVTTSTIEEMLTLLVTHNLFLDVLVPIVDVAKEYQMGQLDFKEFKNLLRLRNLDGADWESDIHTLVDMAKLAQEIGVLSGEIDFYNYDAYKALINDLFDLIILSDKVEAEYAIKVNGQSVQLKTLIVEAAFRQFKIFDVEGADPFDTYREIDRASRIDWENERAVFLELVEQYKSFNEFLETKGDTLTTFTDKITDYLNYEETYDHIIDILDVAVDSNFALATIPYAIQKFVIPLIDDFEKQAGFEDIKESDKISHNITKDVTSDNLASEIFNVIYMVLDAYEVGLFSMLGEDGELQLGSLAYVPEDAALLADFDKYAEELGYDPRNVEEGQLALVDMIERLFSSKILEKREGKVIRIAFAVFLDVRLSKEIYEVQFDEVIKKAKSRERSGKSERQILVESINKFRPILTDPEFKLFNDDGSFNIDYFLTTENVRTIIEGLILLFDSHLIEVVLPEYYNQQLVPNGTIPEEWAEIFQVESLWYQSQGVDGYGGPGFLTGGELCNDIQTLLKMLLLFVDFNALNVLDESQDIQFAGAKDLFDKFFDYLVFSGEDDEVGLYVLQGRGNEIAALVLKQFLDMDIEASDFEDMNVDWPEEVERLNNIIDAVLDLLENSDIPTYRTLMDVLDDPMANLDKFLVDDNVRQLANILNEIGQSHILETVANPLVNKMVVPMLDGLDELSEDEYSGVDIASDIRNLANVLYDIADAELMATVKAVLGEFTDLIPATEEEVAIPLTHELYADIIEQIFSLNALQVHDIKQFVFDKLDDMTGEGIDFSDVNVDNIDFAGDGKILADAYREFVDRYHQDVFDELTFQDIKDIIDGNLGIADLIALAQGDNVLALTDLIDSIFETTLANELGLVGYNYVTENLIPEEYKFLFPEEMTKDEVIEDIHAIFDIVENLINLTGDSLDVIIDNIDDILADPSIITTLPIELDVENMAEYIGNILDDLDNMNMFDGRGKEIVEGALEIAGIELADGALDNVDFQNDKAIAKEVVQDIADLLAGNDLGSIDKVMEALDDPLALVNTENTYKVLEIVDEILDLSILPAVLPDVVDTYLGDTLEEMGLDEIVKFDEEYGAEDLIDDLHTIVGAAEDIVMWGAIDVVNGEDIPWQNIDVVQEAIEDIFAIDLLEAREDEIIDFVADALGVEIVGDPDIDWAGDGEHIADAIGEIAQAAEILELNSLDDITASLEDPMALLDEDAIEHVLDAVDDLIDISIIEEFLPTAIDAIAESDLLPDKINDLIRIDADNPDSYDPADYVEDLHTIVDIVRDVVDMGVLDIIESGEIAWENPENLAEIVEKLLDLNFFDNKEVETLSTALEIFKVDSDLCDLDRLDFDAENETIVEIVETLVELTEELGIYGMDDINELMEEIGDQAKLAEIIDTALPYVAEVLELIGESGYVEEIAVPVYKAILEDELKKALGSQVADMVDLDFYLEDENEGALIGDIHKLGEVVELIDESNIVDFVLGGAELDVEGLRNIGEALETLFDLSYLENKEQTVIDILNSSKYDIALSDQNIDFSADGEALNQIVNDIVDIMESGVIEITTLDDIGNALSVINYEKLFETDEEGNLPYVDAAIDILREIVNLSFLDEGIGIADAIAKENNLLGDEWAFALELGDKGSVGIVEDLNTIIDVIDDVAHLGIIEAIFNGEDVSLHVGETLKESIDKLADLNYIQGKGDQFLTAIADTIDYPGLLEELPIDWEAEKESFKKLIDLGGELLEATGIDSLHDITNYDGKIADLINDETLGIVAEMIDVITDSITVQAAIAAGVVIGLPIVEDMLDEPMKGLAQTDDITVREILEDVDGWSVIIRDILAINIANALFHGDEIYYTIDGVGETGKIAGAEILQLLFANNYLSAKLDTIMEIVESLELGIDLSEVDVQFLQSKVEGEDYTYFAQDGLKLAALYYTLCEKWFTNDWPYATGNDYMKHGIHLDELYKRDYVDGVDAIVTTLLDLNIIEAIIPVGTAIAYNMIEDQSFAFIVDYLFEATNDEIQQDIISLWSGIYGFIDAYEFEYYDSIKAIVEEGFTLENLDFNLSVVHGLVELVDAIWNLNMLDQIKGDRFEEVGSYLIKMVFGSKFDQSDINWDDLSLIFDDYVVIDDVRSGRAVKFFGDEENEIQRATRIALALCQAIDSLGYKDFQEVYALLDDIAGLTKDANVLNAEVVNNLIDMIDLLVNSKLVSGAFLGFYNNIIGNKLDDVHSSLKGLLEMNPGYGYDSVYEIQADVSLILDALREIVDFGAIAVYVEDAEINWADGGRIGQAIEDILSIKFLQQEGKIGYLVEYLQAFLNGMDLSMVDATAFDIAGDGALINEAITILTTKIATLDFFPIKSLADLDSLEFNYEDFIEYGILSAVVDALEKITQTTLVKEIAYVAYENAHEFGMDGIGFLFEAPLTKEQVQSDLVDVIYILREALATQVYNALVDADFPLRGITDHVNNILDTLLHLNILNTDMAKVIQGALANFLEVDVYYADLFAVDYEKDYELIYDAIDNIGQIIYNAKFLTYFELGDYINSLSDTNDILFDKLIVSNENLSLVINTVKDFVNLGIVPVVFGPIYEAIVPSMLEGSGLEEIAELGDYTGAEFVEDLNSILDAVQGLVDFNVLGIYRDGAEIEWTNTEPIENLIEAILGLNFLNEKIGAVIDYVTDNEILDLSEIDAEALDLANDGKLIAEAYAKIANAIMGSTAFPVNTLEDLENLEEFDLGPYINKESLRQVVEALDLITDTTLVAQGVVVGYEMAKELVPEELSFIFDNELTQEQLYEDVKSIVHIVAEVVETEVYSYFFFENDFAIVGISDHINEILDTALHLNIVSADYANLIQNALEQFLEVEVSYHELSGVDYDGDWNKLYDVISIVEDILVSADMLTFYNFVDFVNGLETIPDDILANEKLMTNDNLHLVVDALQDIVNMDLVEVLVKPIYEQVIGNPVEGSELEAFGDLTGYEASQIVADLDSILECAHDAIDFDAYNIYFNNAPIDWENTEPITDIIERLFALNYLEVKKADILDFVTDNVYDVSSMNAENIDFAHDGQIVAEMYEHIAFVADNCLEITNMASIMDLLAGGVSNYMIDDLLAQEAVAVLDLLGDMTIFAEGLNVVEGLLPELVPEGMEFLAELGPNGVEGLREDYERIVDILQIAVDTGIVSFLFQGDNMSLDLEESLQEVIEIIFDLDYLAIGTPDNKLNQLLDYLLEGAGIDDIDTSEIDWNHEEEMLKEIISELQDLLDVNGIVDTLTLNEYLEDVTVGNRVKLAELLTEENVNGVLNIVDLVLDSTITLAAIPFAVNMGHDILDGTGLEFVLDTPASLIVEDLHTIVDVVRDLVADDILPEVIEILKDTENADLVPALRSVNKEVQKLLGINLISSHMDDLLDFIIETLGVDGSNINRQAIVWDEETAIISKIVTKAIDILEMNELNTINNIMSVIDAGEILTDSRIVNTQNIGKVCDMIKALSQSNLIAELAIPCYEAFVAPMFEGIGNETLAEILTVDYETYSPEKFKEDFAIIADLLKTLNKQGALMEVVDLLNNVDISIVIPESYEAIIRSLYSTNLVQDRLDLVIDFVGELLDIEPNREVINSDTDVDVLVKAVYTLCDCLREMDICSLGNVLNTMQHLGEVITTENAILVLDVVDDLMDLTLLHALAIPALDKYVAPMLTGDLEMLADVYNNPDYVLEDLVSDLHALVSVAKSALEFRLVEIYMNDEEIIWSNTEPIENVIEKIFGLKILNNNKQLFLDFVASITDMEFVDFDLDRIDFAHDGEIVAEAYRILALGVLDTALNPIHYFDDLSTATLEYEPFLNKDTLNVVVDALETLVDMTVISYSASYMYDWAKDNVPDGIYFLFGAELTDEQLVEDIKTVVNCLREVIELEAYNYVLGEDIDLSSANVQINNILSAILHTNIISDDYARFTQGAFALFNMEIPYEDLAEIKYEKDFKQIYKVVDELIGVLNDTDLASLNNILAFVDELGSKELDDLIYDESLVNNNNVNHVINIVEDVVNTQLFAVAYAPVYNALFGDQFEKFDETIQSLASIDNYDAEMFVEDINNILEAVRDIVNSGIINVVLYDGIINLDNPTPYANLVEAIYASNYVDAKFDTLLKLVCDMLEIDYEAIDQSGIDNDADAAILGEVIGVVFEILDNNDLDTLQAILDLVDTIGDTYKDYLTKENAILALDAVDLILDMTLVDAMIIPVLDKFVAPELPAELVAIYNNENYVKEDLMSDLHAVVEIARDALEFGALEIYFNDEEINWADSESIENIIKEVFALRILNNNVDKLVDFVATIADMPELADMDISEIDLAADGELVARAYAILAQNILTSSANPIHYLSDITDFNADELMLGDLLEPEYLNPAIDAVEVLVDTTIVGTVVPFLYGWAQDNVSDDIFFLVGADLTKEQLIEDVHTVLDVAREAVEMGVYNLAVEDGDVSLVGAAEHVNNILDMVFHTNLISSDYARIFSGALSLAGIEVPYEELQTINYEHEFKVIYKVVDEAFETLYDINIDSYNDVMDFIDGLDVEELLHDESIVNNNTAHHALNILDLVVDLELVEAVFVPAYNKFVAPMTEDMDENMQALASIDNYDGRMFKEDMNNLIPALHEVVDAGAIGIALYGADINWDKKDALVDLVEAAYATNYVDAKFADILRILCDTIGVDYNSVDQSKIDNEYDAPILGEIVGILCDVLATAGVTTVEEITNIPDNYKDYLTKENIVIALDAVDLALDMTLVQALLVPVLDTYVAPELPAELADIYSNSNYVFEDLLSDAHAIVRIARSAVEFGALDVYFDDAEIDWTNVEPMQEIIEEVFALRILNNNIREVVDYVGTLIDIDLSDFAAEDLDLAADGELFAEAYRILAPVLASSAFPIHFMSDFETMEFDYVEFMEKGILVAGVDALEVLGDTTVVGEALVFAYDYLKNNISDDLYYLVGADLDKAELVEDYYAVLDVVREVIDMEVYEIFNDGDIYFANIDRHINNILDTLLHTNVVSDDYARMLVGSLALANIEVSYEEAQEINYEHEFGVIYDLISEVVATLIDCQLPSYKAVVDYYNALPNVIDEDYIIYEEQIMTNTTLHHLINIVDIATDFDLINVVYNDVYAQFVAGYAVESEYKDFLTIEGYESEMFVEDVKNLVAVAHEIVDFGILDMYRENTEINWADTKVVEDLIVCVFGSNYAQVKTEPIVKLIGELAGIEYHDVDYSKINLAKDAEKIAAAYAIIASTLPLNDAFPFHTLKDIVEFEGELDYNAFLDKDDVTCALDALEQIAATTLYKELARSVFLYANTYLPEEYQWIIKEAELTKSEYVKDTKSLINIARELVDMGVLEVVNDSNITIPEGADVAGVLREFFGLYHYQGREDKFAALLVEKAGSIEINLDDIAWENEEDVLCEVVELAIDMLHDSGVDTYYDLLDLVDLVKEDPKSIVDYNEYWNVENAYTVLDILETLGDSEVYMRSLLVLYDKYGDRLPEEYTSYINMEIYTEEELREDYPAFIEIARLALDAELYKAYKEKKAYIFTDEAVAATEQIVALVCDLHFVNDFTTGLLNMALDMAGVEERPANLADIKPCDDKEELVASVAPLALIWNNSEGMNVHIRHLGNDDMVEALYEVLVNMQTTTILNVLAPWGYQEYFASKYVATNDIDGIDITKINELTDREVIGLYKDFVKVYADLMAIGFLGSQPMNFADTQYVEDIVNIALKYVTLKESWEARLHMYAERSDLADSFQIPWANVASDKAEVKAYKDLVAKLTDIAPAYIDAVKDQDLSVFGDQMKADANAVLDIIERSVILKAVLIPSVNDAAHVLLGEEYLGYTPIPMATFEEFRDALGTFSHILDLTRKLGILDKAPKYKDTETMEELVRSIETNPFVAGQETYIAKIAAKLLNKFTEYDATDIDWSHVVWADEYEMVYRFLDKANEPLNLPGVEISKDINATLSNKEFAAGMVDALEELADSQVLVAFWKKAIGFAGSKYDVINKVVSYAHLDESNYEVYAQTIKQEYLDILRCVDLACDMGIIGEDTNIVNIPKLLELYDLAINLEGLRYTKASLFNEYSDKLPALSDRPVVIPADVDWDNETAALRELIVAFEEFADADGNLNIDILKDIVNETTNVAGLEKALIALNHSAIYRTQLLYAMDESINGLETGDFDVKEFLTDWFKDQVNNGMVGVAEWDEELVYLARILCTINVMKESTGFDELSNIELGVVDSTDAALVATEDFIVEDYGLRQVLQLMYASKSFTITALKGVFENALVDNSADQSGKGVIKTEKQVKDLTEAQWAADIDNIVKLLGDAQTLGLLDTNNSLADSILDLASAEIEAIIMDINHVAAIRELLPDMIADAIDSADASYYKSDWLMAQCGVDAEGNNNEMATVAEWDEEASAIADAIEASNEFEYDTIDVASLTDAEIDKLQSIILTLNASKTFKVDHIVSILDDYLIAKSIDATCNNVVDTNGNGSNKDEWAVEVPKLFAIVKDVNAIGSINSSTIDTNPTALGSILDDMKATVVFGGAAFDAIVYDIFDKNGLIKTTANPEGFIDETDAQTADWSSYNYSTEITILASYDQTKAVTDQDDSVISGLQSSQIIKDYFDIASVVNDKVASKQITIGATTISLADYIHVTNADLAGANWGDELDDINVLVDSMANAATFTATLNDLATSGRTTIAASAASDIKADYSL